MTASTAVPPPTLKRKVGATSFAPVPKRSGLHPTTRINTLAASTSTLTRPKAPTTRSTLGASTAGVQRRIPSTSSTSSGASASSSRRPTGISATRRSTPPGKMPLISAAAKRATGSTRIVSGIGSGMASAAQLQTQSSRMANVEKHLGGLTSLLQQE